MLALSVVRFLVAQQLRAVGDAAAERRALLVLVVRLAQLLAGLARRGGLTAGELRHSRHALAEGRALLAVFVLLALALAVAPVGLGLGG